MLQPNHRKVDKLAEDHLSDRTSGVVEHDVAAASCNSVSNHTYKSTENDWPPELAAHEHVFIDVAFGEVLQQCRSSTEMGSDSHFKSWTDEKTECPAKLRTDKAAVSKVPLQRRNSAYDWQEDIICADQGQDPGNIECIQEGSSDRVMPRVGCAQMVEHVSSTRHKHQVQLCKKLSNKDLVEQAVQDAFNQLKLDLEIRQSEALLELKRCVEKKCQDMHLKQARELQKFKADLTYGKQNHAFHTPLATQVDLEDTPAPGQEGMEDKQSGCHSLQIESPVCPITNSEDRFGDFAICNMPGQEDVNDGTLQRCENDLSDAVLVARWHIALQPQTAP